MPQPDVGDVHVNALLTNISIAHRNARDFYIADKVFPLVPVQKQTDIYPVYTRGYFFADEGTRMVRAPGTRAATTGFKVDNSNTYRAINYAIGVEIPDEIRPNQDAPYNMDRDAAYLLSDLQLIRRERQFAAEFMKTGVWLGQADKTGGSDFTKWSDYAGSDPFADLEDALDAVEGATGMRPNKATMGAIVWRRLKHHPDFIDRIRGGATTGSPALFTKEQLARWLELDDVLVSRASYRTSDEGQTLALSRIMDDDLLLTYTPPSASLMTPAAGYTFYWESSGGLEFVRSGRADREKYDWQENHSYFDQVATEPYAGCFFADCVD